MTKNAHVAPPVGTIYQLSHTRWYKQLREDEYWQVERRTDKTLWMRKLVTDTEGKPVPEMTRTDVPLTQTVPSPLRREPVHPQGRVHGPVQRHLPARPVEAKRVSPARSRPPSSGAYAYPRSTPLTPRPRASTHVDTNAPSVIHCMYQRQTAPRKESTPCRPPFFSTHP